jgi:hypothetical protein
MVGVREYGEEYPVELGRDRKTGRLVIRALNESTLDETRVDLWDLIDWLRSGVAGAELAECGFGNVVGIDRVRREKGP